MILTRKQSELVRLLSQGLTLKEISKRQGKKYSTVKGLAWFVKRRVGQPLAVIIYKFEQAEAIKA
jgi:hypothetical protein